MPPLNPKQKYQHEKAQKSLSHTPYPIDMDSPLVCRVCFFIIKPVNNNEGPESLKAKFSFAHHERNWEK